MAQTTVIKAGNKLNLDELFAGEVDFEKYEKGHYVLKSFSLLKLATNEREYKNTKIYDYYSFGGWTAEGEGRVVYQGPIVKGPHAYLFGQDIVLTAYEQEKETAYFIEVGTELVIGGSTYKVTKNRYTGLELELVQ